MPREANVNDLERPNFITALACYPELPFVFCGRQDGSVCVYDAISGQFTSSLYNHNHQMPITTLLFDEETSVLVSADLANTMLSYKILPGER